jgi:TonB family protein
MKTFLLMAALLAPVSAAQTTTGIVSGEIRTRDGQPAVGVRVSAMAIPDAGVPGNSGTALISIGVTDNQGRYTLENILPGRYYITAGFVDLPTYYPGVSAVSGAMPVQVLAGTPITGINFAAANTLGVTVSGRVRRATGTEGIGGQSVVLIGGTAPIQVTTAADGSFQFLRVLPGSYQLGSAAGRTSQPLAVAVGDQNILGLEIVVVPTVNVTGSVVIEGNGMRPRIQLQLSSFKGTGQSVGVSTQPDGSMRAVMPEGEYRVSWSSLPVGYEIKSVTSGTIDLLTRSLKVSVDAPPEPIRVLVSVEGNPWVKVSGRVTNPGSNRTLILTGPNVDQIQLTVNPDGTFEIPQALPGQYQVRPNPIPAASVAAIRLQATQLISVVIPNQDTTNLVIPLPLMKVVQGIVVNNSGAAVQGRYSLSYQQSILTSSSSGSTSFATPSDGKFTLELSPGSDVHISVSAPGYPTKSLTYGVTDLMRDNMRVAMTDTAELRVVLDTISTTIGVGGAIGGSIGGLVGGVVGGTPGGVLSSSTVGTLISPPPPPPSAPPTTAASPANVNRVSSEVAQSNIASRVEAIYPPSARTARIEGSVVLQFEISIEGRVQNVSVVNGNPLLTAAALDAVRQWTYKPFVLNGKAIPVYTTATVNFKLP